MQKSGNTSVVGELIKNVSNYSGSLFLGYRVPMIEGRRFLRAFSMSDAEPSTRSTKASCRATKRSLWASTGSSLLAQGLPATGRLSICTHIP